MLWYATPVQAKTSLSIAVKTYRPKHPEYRWLKRFLQLRGYRLTTQSNAPSTTLTLQLTAGSKVIIAKGQHTKRYSIPQRLSSPQTRARVCALYLDMFLETLQHKPPIPEPSVTTQAGSKPNIQNPLQRLELKPKPPKRLKQRAKRRNRRRARRKTAQSTHAQTTSVRSRQRDASQPKRSKEPPSPRISGTKRPARRTAKHSTGSAFRSHPPQQKKPQATLTRLQPKSSKGSRQARTPTSQRPQPLKPKRQAVPQARRRSATPKLTIRTHNAKLSTKASVPPEKKLAMAELRKPQPLPSKRRIWGDILSLDIGLSGGLRYTSNVPIQGGGSVLLGLNVWRWTVRFDLHLHSYHLREQTREILFLRPSVWLGYRIPLGRLEQRMELIALLGVVSEFAVKHDEKAYATEMIWGAALGLHVGVKLYQRWSLFVRPSLQVYPRGVSELYQNTVDLDPAGNTVTEFVVPAFQFSALLGVQVRL